MNNSPKHIQDALNLRRETNSLRVLSPVDSGRIDFMSNDYFGYSTIRFENDKPSGGTGSRLISGTTFSHAEVERETASFFGSKASLLFNSGYNANMGLFSCLGAKKDLYLYDELIHASIREAMRLSPSKSFKFKHNSVLDLKRKLSRFKEDFDAIYVIVESVYSMDGDKAVLKEIAQLCKEFDVFLIVDEAHALGVFGKGLVSEWNLTHLVYARIVTFGKALGFHGAAILSNQELIDFLINFSKPFIYTTALSEKDVVEILDRLRYMIKSDSRLLLEKNIKYFLSCADFEGFSQNDTSIQTFRIGDIHKAKKIEKVLKEKGFALKAILSPTVPKGTERIRICLHTYNSKEEISALVKLLKDYV